MPTDQDLIEIVEEIIDANDTSTASEVLVEIIQKAFDTGYVRGRQEQSQTRRGYDIESDWGIKRTWNDEIKKIIDDACEKHFG